MIIGMPVYEGVELLDVAGPYEMFRWADIEVELVAKTPGLVRFNRGFRFEVPTSFADAGRWDVLFVPGGDPSVLPELMRDPQRTYLDFLIRQSEQAKFVCSVCEGALLLAAAGLLDGFEATTHWLFIPCLKRFPNVTVVPGFPRFHLDRNRLTGGGVSSGLDEALKLIELLRGTEAAQAAQLATQYFPRPPVTSEIPIVDQCSMPIVTIPPPRPPPAPA
jgi:transcriptional regulator GlxA family with amidase domain